MPGLLQGLPAEQAALREPSIPGDHPDPSVIRVGKEYWATSTSGDCAPAFPLFRSASSPDTWRQVGSIFETPPAWAKGDFWAPVNDRGHIFAYYTARNSNGVLCVAVATANTPQGPYTDHGPLFCQPDGSIDAGFIRNRDGSLT
jgi:beta-xylosidase